MTDQDLHAILSIVQLSQTSGTLNKQAMLRSNASVPGFKELLRFIYNPYLMTGISEAKLKAAYADTTADDISIAAFLVYFSIPRTGNATDVSYMVEFIKQYEVECLQDVVLQIAARTFKTGVDVTTLNKVYGNTFIPKIGCMLGTQLNKAKNVKGPFIVTEKLDGIRRILCIDEHGAITVYSRSGIQDEGLQEIEAEAKYLPRNMMYDGELLAKGEFKDSIALRQATNSIANRKGIKTGLTFNVFDMVPLDEFKAGVSSENAYNRKIRLGATFNDKGIKYLRHDDYQRFLSAYNINTALEHIKVVPILGTIKNIAEATPIVEPIWKAGGEGIMLNTFDGFYETDKRTKTLLKIKKTESIALPIIGYLEGIGKNEGTLGSVIVDYKGYKVGVGSGFTDDQRNYVWANRGDLLHTVIELDTFGESTDKLGNISLNCAIFKRFSTIIE